MIQLNSASDILVVILKIIDKIERIELYVSPPHWGQECLTSTNSEALRYEQVRVEILDINDNAPFFPVPFTQLELSESAEPGTSFIIPAAEDLDSAKNSVNISSYHIHPPTPFFDLSVRVVTPPAVGARRGGDVIDLGAPPSTQIRLVLRQRVDRESTDHFRLSVVVSDSGNPVLTGSLVVNVTVTDVNDNRPRFVRPGSENTATSGPAETRLPESASVGSAVYRVRAVDSDTGEYGRIKYKLAAETRRDYGKMFDIDADTGQIFTRSVLDHETQATYVLYILAVDGDPADRKSAQTSVIIHVDDVNDNSPTIRINAPARDSRGPEIVNGSDVGSFVAHMTVEDRDSGPNGRFHCRITENSRVFDLRQLYATEYKVVTLTRIVAPTSTSPIRTRFSITCRDDGRPSLSTTLPVEVFIIARNDHAPEFELTEYGFVVAENEKAGRVVGHVSATDRDEGAAGTVHYRTDTDGEPCASVDRTTGAIRTSTSFDRETAASCEIFVMATDGGVPPRSARVNVRITVADVDDSSAKFHRSNYVFSVPENQPADTEVGRIEAADADQVPFSDVVYAVDRITGYDGNGSLVVVTDMAFSVDASTGHIVTSYPLDRETVSGYRIVITASSTMAGITRTATATVVVNVVDVNDNPPVFLFPPKTDKADGVEGSPLIVPLSAAVGDNVATISAVDSDAGANRELVYSITGTTPTSARSLFALNRLSGQLTVAGKLPGVGLVRVQLAASDGGDVLPEVDRLTTTSTLTVKIVDNGRDRRLRRVKDDSLMSALASHHLAVVLTGTLAAILFVISAIIALLCLLRMRRLRRHHDDVKYVDGVAATVYGCARRDVTCFRFQDGDAGSRAAARDSSELKKLPVNVDGDVTYKQCQVRTIV